MMLWLTLFFEFFKTGLFSIGGGLATIPFLYEMMEHYHWFSESDLLNMIAISESTPGPVGVNMATYVGYHVTGNNVFGAIWATFALVLPSVIVICAIAKVLQAYRKNPYVQDMFYGLRPATAALILSAAIGVLLSVIMPNNKLVFDTHLLLTLVIMAGIWIFTKVFKKIHPIAIICLSAAIGVLFSL